MRRGLRRRRARRLTSGLRPLTFAPWATVAAVVAMFALGLSARRPWRWIGLSVAAALRPQVAASLAVVG